MFDDGSLIRHSNQEIESRWQEEGTWNLKQLLHTLQDSSFPVTLSCWYGTGACRCANVG